MFSRGLLDVLARNASCPRRACKIGSPGIFLASEPFCTFSIRRAATSNPEPNYAVKAHNLGPAEQFAADIFAECGKIVPKLKFDLGSVPSLLIPGATDAAPRNAAPFRNPRLFVACIFLPSIFAKTTLRSQN